MSKLKMNCGYCGRKCDLDKDFCIPQDSVYVCKSCYEWQSKLADLEAKLAQAQKTIEIQKMSNDALQEENLDYRYDITDTAYEQAKEMAKGWEEDYQQEIEQLKQQLAEKENTITNLIEDSRASKDWYKQQLAGLQQEKIEYTDTINFVETSEPHIVAKELDRLNQQLAEKDAEIEEFKNRERKIFSLSLHTEFENKLKQANQDKISFAVECLERVKRPFEHHLNNKLFSVEYRQHIRSFFNEIDNQIKQLKGK